METPRAGETASAVIRSEEIVPRAPGSRVLAALMSVLLVIGLPAPGYGTHNKGRTWDQQQFGIRDYAPCYRYLKSMSSSFRSRVSEARTKWNAANTEFYIWYTSSNCAKDIEVDYYDLPIPFDNAWAYVANDWFGNISYSTINFNSCKDSPNGCTPWYTGTGTPPDTWIDLISVATHEFGHTVELGHSENCNPSCSIMYPWINPGETRRFLNSHDHQTLRAMYAYPAT